MKSKKLTITSSLSEKQNIVQNETQSSLSRRSFMKESLAASAGVVAAPGLIADPAPQRKTAKPPI